MNQEIQFTIIGETMELMFMPMFLPSDKEKVAALVQEVLQRNNYVQCSRSCGLKPNGFYLDYRSSLLDGADTRGVPVIDVRLNGVERCQKVIDLLSAKGLCCGRTSAETYTIRIFGYTRKSYPCRARFSSFSSKLEAEVWLERIKRHLQHPSCGLCFSPESRIEQTSGTFYIESNSSDYFGVLPEPVPNIYIRVKANECDAVVGLCNRHELLMLLDYDSPTGENIVVVRGFKETAYSF